MISTLTRKLLLASKVKGVGKRTLLGFSEDRLFYELTEYEWYRDIPQLSAFVPSSAAFSDALVLAQADIEQAEKQNCRILSAWDAEYPDLLRTLDDRPPLLYVRGDPANFSKKAVAIVGTRSPSPHGEIVTARISAYFARKGWQVVSGLAKGIDTVAHQVTLQESGSAVAVLAHGLDTIYPKQNANLAQEIIDTGGLLVSEYPFGTPGFPPNFIERDRIQAALSRGVIMVQSGETGGSWHASRAALRYKRWLLVPAPTRRDMSMAHPKARGNYIMVQGTDSEKLEILKCEPAALTQVFPLHSKDDYEHAEMVLLGEQDTVSVAHNKDIS